MPIIYFMAPYSASATALGAGPVVEPRDIDLGALEELAKTAIGQMAYDYYAGGAEDGGLVQENIAGWGQWNLSPKVLVDVSTISTRTKLLGSDVMGPIVVAPTALHAMATPGAERDTARACARAGAMMTLSSLSNAPLDEVAEAGGGAPQWMQVYILKDRGRTKEMVEQVAVAGYKALLLTVDAPVSGLRYQELRGGVSLRDDLELPNLTDASTTRVKGEGFMAAVCQEFDPSITYDDIAWLSELSHLPVLAKGVTRSDDALKCLDAGAAGVVVSNHGGRQLRDAPAPATVLPEIAESLTGRGTLLVDGGIRRPADVLKALALGADGVLIGRPALWALGSGGEDGLVALLEWFTLELRRVMALCGVRSLQEIDATLVRRKVPS
jgi:4-hydroxymandelate oxidase